MTTPTPGALDMLRGHLGITEPSVPAPLPPIREDPSIVAGYAVKARCEAAMQAARNAVGVTDVDRAKGVLKAWKAGVDELTTLWGDLTARRTARREWIQQQLPFGPGVPDGVSAADRAVLMQAFNMALGAARQMTAEQRAAALADASRFGDDVTLRATLTAAVDASAWQVIDRWAEQHAPQTGALLAEWRDLGATLAGQSFDSRWDSQALQLPARPPEYTDLPVLTAAVNAAIRSANAEALRTGAPTQMPVELDMAEYTPSPGS